MSRDDFLNILYAEREGLVLQRNELMATTVCQDLFAAVGALQMLDQIIGNLPEDNDAPVEDAGL